MQGAKRPAFNTRRSGQLRAVSIASEFPAIEQNEEGAELGGFPEMTDRLQISVHNDGHGAVMYLRGRVSIESSPDLRNQLLAMLRRQSRPATIAVDLAAVSYMDASGIATLIEGLKIARLGGIAMRLQGLQGRPLHLFKATGIDSLFDTGGPTNNLSTTRVS
jgi:anti-sigma B factor antagonist